MTEPIVAPITPPDPGATPAPGGEPPKTFTQEDLDRIIKERLAREQTRYADYDDLKKAASELKKLKDAELSESEKLRSELAEWQQKQADWETERTTITTEHNQQLLKAEVRVQAAGLGFIDPDEAYLLADLTEVDAKDRPKGVKKALETLAKNKSHLLKGAGAPGSPANVTGKKTASDDELLQGVRERYGIRAPTKTGG